MALNIGSLGSALASSPAAQLAALARTSTMQYTANGGEDSLDDLTADSFSVASLARSGGAKAVPQGAARSEGATQATSFEQALLKAIDGVSASQGKSDSLLQQVVANPDSVDAQDVTIAMAEANMSLNLAKTIMSRVVTAWKDIINTR
jgi:flagellar hook-basal body complex protein FliE